MAKATKKKAAAPSGASKKRGTGELRKRNRKSKTGRAASPHPEEATGQDLSDDSLLAPPVSANPDVLNRLWTIIDNRKGADPTVSHSARLLAKGTSQVVQKLGEELIECLIEAMAGNRAGLVGESADVLYHLLITWVNAGIHPEEVWEELTRREKISHLTEGAEIRTTTLLGGTQVGTTKIP
jgi:phosphoribosyl-ATP pyrophosphohydrolase